jgi:hypothetical protein
MPAKKDQAAILANNMVRVLEAQRSLGPESYPPTLRRLAELTDPAAPPELVQQAAAKRKPFGERVFAVRPKDLDSPVALAEDLERLAGGSRTLEYLLASLCSATEPTCDLARLKKTLPTKLRRPFEAAFVHRIETRDLPPGVSILEAKKKKLLYLDRYPPPPPPLPPEDALGEDLLQALHAQRQAGGDAYPPTIARLVDLARPGADAKLIQGAFSRTAFNEKVTIALKKQNRRDRLESPIALAADRNMLAGSPVLLEVAVTLARSETTQLLTEKDLKTKIAAPLHASFAVALARRVATHSLPPTIGSLLQKKKPLFFLIADVRSGLSVIHATSSGAGVSPDATWRVTESDQAAPDFARAFDEAYERIERERGHNFVSLVDLRRAIRSDRPTFDAGLQSLRRAGRYTLSAAEGRDGISPEENLAGIREDGSLLLYVSRRLS